MYKMNLKLNCYSNDVSMVLLILLSICCQISLTNSIPILDPSQIELLIDPLHQAELAGLESKKVVAKSVFNTPIRTPAPHVNRCPPGHHTPQPGGPCVQNLVFVQNDPELIAELTKKFFRDRSSTKKKTNAHRHRTTTLRTPTETVPTTTEAEWMVLSGDSGMFPTEFTTPRTIMSTASVTGRPTKLSESGVDSIVNPMGSASIPDPDHSLPPTPQQQQQQQQQPSFHHQQQQHYTGNNNHKYDDKSSNSNSSSSAVVESISISSLDSNSSSSSSLPQYRSRASSTNFDFETESSSFSSRDSQRHRDNNGIIKSIATTTGDDNVKSNKQPA